jgi:hypothetical protein
MASRREVLFLTTQTGADGDALQARLASQSRPIPTTETNQNLFLLDQKEAKDEEEGSFTVGVDAKATDDIKFNYLIVN